jgi:hypothetical protein
VDIHCPAFMSTRPKRTLPAVATRGPNYSCSCDVIGTAFSQNIKGLSPNRQTVVQLPMQTFAKTHEQRTEDRYGERACLF